MILNSYAKLNLYLEVINRRKDRYHNIKTLFERIDLCDKIILKTRQDKKIKITCSRPGIPKDSSNLAYQSAKLLKDGLGVEEGVDIKIIKRIPQGAGLGGGSSNAACVLLGLNRLWKLNLTKNKLLGIARKIGCDVPFFIYDCPFALGSERGDKIEPLRLLGLARFWHILVIPKEEVSTAKIYKKWDRACATLELTPHLCRYSKKNNENEFDKGAGLTKPKYNVRILTLAIKKNDLGLIGKGLFNSLEQITVRLYPELRLIKERLRQAGLKTILMSGSGPAIFSMVSSRREGMNLCRQLRLENGSWEIFLTRTR